MKLEKLDKKQVPQVVGLTVLSVVLLSVAAYQLLTAEPGTKKAAAQEGEATAARVAQRPNLALGELPADIVLPSTFHPDPFAPPRGANTPAPDDGAGLPGQGGAVVTINPPPLDSWGPPGNFLPGLMNLPEPAQPGGVAPLTPAGPLRPQIKLTGVIEGDPHMALVELPDNDRRILLIGDMLPNGYRVERIQLNGIRLALRGGDDRWFVPVGYDHDAETKEAAAAPALTP